MVEWGQPELIPHLGMGHRGRAHGGSSSTALDGSKGREGAAVAGAAEAVAAALV